jgi:hypothetical protein
MTAPVENALYHPIIDRRFTEAVFVFVGTDPGAEHASASVVLQLLPPAQRFGGSSGVATGRPALGRWPGGLSRFRQFLTTSELEAGGWVPVSQYRVCDCWADYFSPWARPAAEPPAVLQSTAHGPTDPSETVGA